MRVKFFQSSQPQQVSPPELVLFGCGGAGAGGGLGAAGDTNNNSFSELNNNLSEAATAELLLLYGIDASTLDTPEKMAAVAQFQQQHGHPPYDRQMR